MSRRRTLSLLLALALAGSATVPAQAEGELAAARREFVKTRNACRFDAAVRDLPGTEDRVVPDILLSMMACQKAAPAPTPNSSGYDALPGVVTALRALDLEGAAECAARVGSTAGGGVGIWARALILARRGRDAEAVALLLAPPADPDLDVERVLFPLSLFGAALPKDDRLLLAATARETMFEACRRGRLERIASLARQTAALDHILGPDLVGLAARALRRAGRMQQEVGALISGPETQFNDRARSCVQLERAVHEWRAGRGARARALSRGLVVAPYEAFLAKGLARAGDGFAPVPPVPQTEQAVRGVHAASVLARYATLLGLRADARSVEALALGRNRGADEPGFACDYLAQQGLDVVLAAGSARAGEAALERGLPFLLYRIRLRGGSFVEEPVIVRGRDTASGLWIVDPDDLSDLDALPPDAPLKGRLLVAVPSLDRGSASPASWAPERERVLGRSLVAALDVAAQGNLAGAIERMERRVPDLGTEPVFQLYRGFLHHRRFQVDGDPTSLHLALDAVRRSSTSTPVTVLEHVVRGEGSRRFASTVAELDQGIAELASAQAGAPFSSYLALKRFDLLKLARHRREALDALDRAREIDPRDTRSLFLRGGLRADLGDTEGARRDLRRAFERRPTSRAAVFELVDLEFSDRRPAAALAVLHEYMDGVPEAAEDETVCAARRVAEGRLVQLATTVDALRPYLASPLPETRRRVVFALAQVETAEAEATLRTLLADPDHAVRVTVLHVYMRPRLRARVESDEDLGARVVELLKQDENDYVRGAAAGLLGLVRKGYVAAELATTLAGDSKDPDPIPRAEAALALARHDGGLARRALVEALEDVDVDVRSAAIEALFKLALTQLGYDPKGSPEERAVAVERWRRWLRENGG